MVTWYAIPPMFPVISPPFITALPAFFTIMPLPPVSVPASIVNCPPSTVTTHPASTPPFTSCIVSPSIWSRNARSSWTGSGSPSMSVSTPPFLTWIPPLNINPFRSRTASVLTVNFPVMSCVNFAVSPASIAACSSSCVATSVTPAAKAADSVNTIGVILNTMHTANTSPVIRFAFMCLRPLPSALPIYYVIFLSINQRKSNKKVVNTAKICEIKMMRQQNITALSCSETKSVRIASGKERAFDRTGVSG